MVVVRLCVVENHPMQWPIIVETDIECDMLWTVSRAVQVAKDSMQMVQWQNARLVYEFNGNIIGRNTLIKTLLKQAEGNLMRPRLKLLLSLRGGPEMPDGNLASLRI